MEPLLKSDKTIQTPAQEAQLQRIVRETDEAYDSDMLTEYSSNISFTPTQFWIDKFALLGFHFYPDESVPHAQFHILHKNRPRSGNVKPDKEPWELRTEEPEPVDGSLWAPQNGKLIEASFRTDPKDTDFFRCIYVGFDGICHVVFYDREASSESTTRLHKTPLDDRAYVGVQSIRPFKKTQVPLAELLSVYASVKGLTQDGVELKPEN